MKHLQFQPFDKKELIEKLKLKFPTYRILNIPFLGLQIRTKAFTISGNVELYLNEKTGKIKTHTFLDLIILWIIVCWPIALYAFLKRETIKQNEEKVINALNEILASQTKLQ